MQWSNLMQHQSENITDIVTTHGTNRKYRGDVEDQKTTIVEASRFRF
jgi:hypothetical protein